MQQRSLVLVRHGQTPSNRLGLIQGRLDVDLSDEGVRQATQLADKLSGEKFDRAYSSELVRARHTAEILLTGHGLELTTDSRLNEIDQGEWTGKSGPDLYKTEERYRVWASRPLKAHPPGGESMEQVASRAESFLKDVQEGHTLVVAHGGLIAVMRSLLREAPLEEAWSFLPGNVEVVRERYKVSG